MPVVLATLLTDQRYGAGDGIDANGNLASDSVSSYAYDIENRLVSGGGGATLTWNPLGRLYQVAGGSGTTQFLYDGDRLVGEYDGGGALLRRYVHGTGADDPLVWYEGSGLTSRRALQADHQGSIIAVFDGGSVTPYAYDDYGIPNPGQTARFQYTGQAWIPELGMYHYKARFYSPTLGRFLQTDPIGYDDQINLYAYVANDPVNNNDPTGTCLGPAAVPCVVVGGAIVARGAQCVANAGCREAVKIGVRWAIREVVKQLTTTPVSPMTNPDGEGGRQKAKDRRAEQQAAERERKHGDPNWEEPSSEKSATNAAKEVQREAGGGEAGRQARREFHDAKRSGEGDRSRRQLREDADDIRRKR